MVICRLIFLTTGENRGGFIISLTCLSVCGIVTPKRMCRFDLVIFCVKGDFINGVFSQFLKKQEIYFLENCLRTPHILQSEDY